MNLALVYKNINSPSYIFYKDAFKKIGKNNKSIKVTFEKFSKKTLEKNFDVILFMSGAANENFKKKKNIKYGIVDPRAANYDNFNNFDFIIANGLEEKFYFSYTNLPIMIYPVFPLVNCIKKNNKNKTVITYHGNKEHLQNMHPRITDALKKISKNYQVELRLIYNLRGKGAVREVNKNYLN